MSVHELTTEQLQVRSWPGTHLTPEDCLSAVRNLKGSTVVVTGAGSGFGRGYSLLAAKHGSRIVASDVNLPAVQSLVEEIKQQGGEAIATRCDTSLWDDQVAMFELAVKTYGAVDSVIANAGVSEMREPCGFFEGKEGADGKPMKPSTTTIEINLLGAAYTAHLAFHHLSKNPSKGHKSIVLLGSMSSFFGIPLGPMYTTSKHAMLGLFRTLYHSAGPAGININIVCPWFCATGILKAPVLLSVAGLPLADVKHVVEAMLKGSSDPEVTGNILAVDATGVLAIPQDAFITGEGGYYRAFLERASYAVSTIQTIKDCVKALSGPRKSTPTKNAVKVVGLAVLAYGTYGASEVGVTGWVVRGVGAAGLVVL